MVLPTDTGAIDRTYKRFRGGKVVQVVQVDVAEGEDTREAPIRIVTYYLSLEGRVLAVTDGAPSGVGGGG